jgi:hypothetical protein
MHHVKACYGQGGMLEAGNNMTDDEIRELIRHEHELRAQWQDMNERFLQTARNQVYTRLEILEKMIDQVNAERRLYLTQASYDLTHTALEHRVNSLEIDRAKLFGVIIAMGALMSLVSLGVHFLPTHF